MAEGIKKYHIDDSNFGQLLNSVTANLHNFDNSILIARGLGSIVPTKTKQAQLE